jgi:hypothetical protein
MKGLKARNRYTTQDRTEILKNGKEMWEERWEGDRGKERIKERRATA